MDKLIFFDLETTGLDATLQDIVQIGALIEEDGKIIDEINLKCQPFSYENISPKALEVNKIAIAELKTYPQPQVTYAEFTDKLKKMTHYGDNKLKLIGANSSFDIDFIIQFFKKNKSGYNEYFGKYIDMFSYFDVTAFCRALKHHGIIEVENCKLGTLSKHFGVVNKSAHDAVGDCFATREIYYILKDRYIDKLKPVITK